MYWERNFLRTAEPWDVGGTLKLDLPMGGQLGSIMVHARRAGVTDAFNAIEKWRLIDYISKVEIIANGSTIIKSLTGEALKALTFFDGGGSAPDQEFNYGGSTKRAHFMINFGRKLFDQKYGLDLSKFANVQIQLTNDGAAAQFAGAWAVDVLCYYMRGADVQPPAGYMRTEEWRKWTTVADERKYLDIPTELPVRRMILQVLSGVSATKNATIQAYNVLDDIEMYLRSRVIKVMDYSLRDLWYENYFDYGRQAMAALEPYHTSLYGIKTGLGQTLAKAGIALPQGMASATPTIALEAGNDGSTQKIFRSSTDNASMILLGLALENCAVIRFDQDPDNPGSWLDPNAEKTVNLDLHTANDSNAASGTIRVILDRLVKY